MGSPLHTYSTTDEGDKRSTVEYEVRVSVLEYRIVHRTAHCAPEKRKDYGIPP